MKKTYHVTDVYRSESEEERARNFQRIIEGYLQAAQDLDPAPWEEDTP